LATTDAVPGPCVVRFDFFLRRAPKLGGLGCTQGRHVDPPSSVSRSCVVHESKGDPSTPWFLCRTFKSISSFISAKFMTASSKNGTHPVVRWLFPFIIRTGRAIYSLSPPPKNTPCPNHSISQSYPFRRRTRENDKHTMGGAANNSANN